MADFDVVVLVLSEHDAFRRAFVALEDLSDPAEQKAAWDELADRLEVHASAEEQVFYPHLLDEVDGSEGETRHAIQDHNEIRDACRAVADHEVGTDEWNAAVQTAREVTVEHLDEEERDVLPPFRDSVGEERRSELGVAWLAFLDEHERAKGLSGDNEDPEAYVEQHT
jgi:hemerythrin-like domain-containing protein